MDNNAKVPPTIPPVIPPGIAPKLPEVAPAPLKSKVSFSKRELLIGGAAAVLLVALAVWFVIFAVGAGRTAAQTVQNSAPEGYTLQEPIVQVGLPGSETRSVLFYVSNNGLACALLEHKASGYKLLDTFGHIGLAGTGEGEWNLTSLSGGNREMFLFGILYDEGLSTVEVNGSPAVVVNSGDYRLWYYIAEGSESINRNSVYYR